jgi:hypothetical protein
MKLPFAMAIFCHVLKEILNSCRVCSSVIEWLCSVSKTLASICITVKKTLQKYLLSRERAKREKDRIGKKRWREREIIKVKFRWSYRGCKRAEASLFLAAFHLQPNPPWRVQNHRRWKINSTKDKRNDIFGLPLHSLNVTVRKTIQREE